MDNKIKHISYWTKMAIDDLETIDFLFEAKKYMQALFFCHLSIEKYLKAHWVKDNIENIPPKTHNLLYLHGQTNLHLPEEDTNFLQILNAYQIEGRYPDYIGILYNNTLAVDAEKIIILTKKLFQCLQEKLQLKL